MASSPATKDSKRRLRVGIDAHALGSDLGGNETYLRSLLTGLRSHPEHDYVLYITHPGAREIAARLLPGAECRSVSGNPLKRLGIDLPIASWFHGLDLIHLQYVAPLLPGCPISLLIHDLSYEHAPSWFHPSEVQRFRWTIPRSASLAKVVLTISDFCREDIIRRLQLPPDKVVVTPNSLPPFCKPAEESAILGLKKRVGISQRYILALGNLQPRKNITTLLQAWRSIRDRPELHDVALVITGKKAWLYEEILKEAEVAEEANQRDHGRTGKDRVTFTGYLPEEDLPALYSGALLFVYPSLFEGFGLPPLEAMACGTPVIVGRNSALPEVCGEAARYSCVTDPDQLGEEILALSLDQSGRDSLSLAGIARAGTFTLEKLTLPTVQAWERIA
jgi:glycosyltransferase involved in cell wall biosynthesis